MTPTRREFIQSLGVALASWVLTGCGPTPEPDVIIECYIIVTDEVEVPRGKAQRLQRVRDCWSRLDWLAEQAQEGAEEARLAKQELIEEHSAALRALVASGEMSEDVDHYVQLAFEAAINHVIEPDIVSTCYVLEETPPPTPTLEVAQMARKIVTDYASGSGERLAQQADLLSEMAVTSDIDPGTVERAQSAIERDMMLLYPPDREDLIARLIEAAGGTYDFPPIEEFAQDIPPEAVEAALFLVELLLEE
jgi:hypothetical protein